MKIESFVPIENLSTDPNSSVNQAFRKQAAGRCFSWNRVFVFEEYAEDDSKKRIHVITLNFFERIKDFFARLISGAYLPQLSFFINKAIVPLPSQNAEKLFTRVLGPKTPGPRPSIDESKIFQICSSFGSISQEEFSEIKQRAAAFLKLVKWEQHEKEARISLAEFEQQFSIEEAIGVIVYLLFSEQITYCWVPIRANMPFFPMVISIDSSIKVSENQMGPWYLITKNSFTGLRNEISKKIPTIDQLQKNNPQWFNDTENKGAISELPLFLQRISPSSPRALSVLIC